MPDLWSTAELTPMDIYNIYCDLQPGVRDTEFTEACMQYFEQLKQRGDVVAWRISRCKLGLGVAELGEWHIALEFNDLAQLDRAFHAASTRAEPIEGLHHAVNRRARNVKFALYRDFPDPQRVHGQEKF